MNKKILIFSSVLIVLIILGSLYYFFFYKKNGSIFSPTQNTGQENNIENTPSSQNTGSYTPVYDENIVKVFERKVETIEITGPKKDGDLPVVKNIYNENDGWVDTDGDGIPDDYEAKYGTDAKNQDTDNDGLTDFDEIRLKINPLFGDTDGDGVNDSQEIKNATDPSNAESK